MTSKINTGKFSYQYGYDLRNRLASANIARKEGLQDVTITSSYAYNTAGIRTRAEQTINGITQNRYFLLDSGHTGYAQVFEETSSLGGNLVRSYVLGDDVLSQNVGGVNSHLLYDGHGSTRQLAGDDGAVSANYAYDAYGKMLGGNPGVTDGKQSATDLLYAGEQFDAGLQMEYLRARYYDQDNGRFNRLDPFDGNSEDPQSLHKYAYAHCDPVNGIDPTGESLIALMIEIFNYAQSRSAEIKIKAGQGAAALGTLFATMGKQIEQFAMQLLTYFPQIKVFPQTRLGHNIIDFMLKHGSKIVDLEVKYSLPRRVGPQCTRLINQINSMLAHAEAGERVIWTFTKPTSQQIQFWMMQLGDKYNKITWVYGPEGLLTWIQEFLGL